MDRRSFLQALTALVTAAALPLQAKDVTTNQSITTTVDNPYIGKEHLFYISKGNNSWIVPIRTVINQHPGPKYIPGPHAFMFYVDYVEDLTQDIIIKSKISGVGKVQHLPFTKHLADLDQLHKELKIHTPKYLW
jgi:hypothetical protein